MAIVCLLKLPFFLAKTLWTVWNYKKNKNTYGVYRLPWYHQCIEEEKDTEDIEWRNENAFLKEEPFFFACSISRIKVSFKRVEKFTFSILRHTAYWNDTFWQRRGRFPIWKVTITSKTSLNVDCIVKKYFFPIFIWVKNCAVCLEYQVLLLSSSLKKKGRRQGEALYIRTYLISETCFDF